MKANVCTTCKHGRSMYDSDMFFIKRDRFYVECSLLQFNEITPSLHDFICTCGCASWKPSDDLVGRSIDDH